MKDEITTTGLALLQTTNRDSLTLDGKTKVRVTKATNGFSYVYVRQGGLHFDTKSGAVYVCIGNHLYIPGKDARGSMKLGQSNAVSANLDNGAFTEQGKRTCGQDVTGAFLAGLPASAGGTAGAAGGAIGGAAAGGLSAGAITGIAVGGAAAAGAGAAAAFSGSSSQSPCTTAAGCNFNPPSISPSTP